MNDVEKQFRDRVGEVLGKYCPNETSLNNLSVYLFREVLDVLMENRDLMKEIFMNYQKNTDMDKVTFMKSVKDLSVSCTQELVHKVFAKSFMDMKNKVPMSFPLVVNEKGVVINQKKESDLNRNVGQFDINIENIPKVEKKPQKPVQKVKETSNVFDGVELDLDEINQRTTKQNSFRKVNVNKSENNVKQNQEQDFITDASEFTSEVYTSVPKVEDGLDY